MMTMRWRVVDGSLGIPNKRRETAICKMPASRW